MASLLQTSLGLLRSRLSRRIVSWVFFSIIVIEGIIFVPAYHRRQREKLRDLEELSSEVLFTAKANAMGGVAGDALLAAIAASLKPDSIIQGLALYQDDGALVGVVGDRPTITGDSVPTGQVVRQLHANGRRYDVAWPSDRFQNQYILVVRHDATGVQREMVQYALAIAGLVVIISAFVTGVTIWVLERILIVPVLHLRDDLLRAAEAVGQEQPPRFHSDCLQRRDELGEVTQAFRNLFQQASQEIRDRKRAEAALNAEKQKSEALLLNILPAPIADQLKQTSGAIACRFEEVSILFADIVDFTGLAAQISPSQLVNLLNDIFSTFDGLVERFGLEKIKTIGDAYMVVGGLPEPRADHAEAILELAIAMQTAIKNFRRHDGSPFHLRIGINTGPVVAGVIGLKKFSYDLWGDAVNIASRLESHGLVDAIQVSAATYRCLQNRYQFQDRGCIAIKGRGSLQTYLYQGRRTASPLEPPPIGDTS